MSAKIPRTSKRSDPDGGHRSGRRHNTEYAVGATVAVGLVTLLPEGLTPVQIAGATAALSGFFGWIAKLNNENAIASTVVMGILKRFGFVALVMLMSTGCAMHFGTISPKQFPSADMSEVIISCDMKGVTLALGDGAVCHGSTEGGHISQSFTNLALGLVTAAAQMVGGFFGNLGAAITPAAPLYTDED